MRVHEPKDLIIVTQHVQLVMHANCFSSSLVLENPRWLDTLNGAGWCIGSSVLGSDSQTFASCARHSHSFLVLQQSSYHLTNLYRYESWSALCKCKQQPLLLPPTD